MEENNPYLHTYLYMYLSPLSHRALCPLLEHKPAPRFLTYVRNVCTCTLLTPYI